MGRGVDRQQEKKKKLLKRDVARLIIVNTYYTFWFLRLIAEINLKFVFPLTRAPRFCVTHTSSTKHASAELKFWHLRQEKPRKDVDPFPQMATLLPLRPKSCIPQLSEMQVGCPAILWSLKMLMLGFCTLALKFYHKLLIFFFGFC